MKMEAEGIRKVSRNLFTTTTLYSVKTKIKEILFSLSNGSIVEGTKCINSEISCDHRIHTEDPLSYSPTFLTITSAGPSADIDGDQLGMYEVRGTHNGSPFYRQVDTVRRDREEFEFFVYRRENGGWGMGPGLDGSISIRNQNKTESVPLTGWEWRWDCQSQFRDDPLLKISSGPTLPCGDITIRASRSVEYMYPECIGVYNPTQIFSGGCRVFKHVSQERYILSQPDCFNWHVQDSVDTTPFSLLEKSHHVDKKGSYMVSGSAPSMCPADPRARTNQSFGLSSWNYRVSRRNKKIIMREDPLINVTCSVHSYLHDRDDVIF